MRALMALLVLAVLSAAEPATTVTPAENLAWHAPTDAEHPPSLGLATGAERYLADLVPLHDPPEAAPATRILPLATHDLLLATWGTRTSGGYDVAATALRITPRQVTVILRCAVPNPDQPTTAAVTHPATLVPVPKRSRLVVRLTGDRAPAGQDDFVAASGGGFTVIDDRRAP